MNHSFIANLSLKILAVYTVILAIKNLPMFISNMQSILFMRNSGMDENSLLFLLGGIPFLTLAFVGILLWVYAEKISSFILREHNFNELEAKEKKLQITLFSVVGLLVLVQTLPQWFNLIPGLIFLTEKYRMSVATNEIHTYTYLIGLLLQVSIGLYLFLGARGLVGVLRVLRKH
ncbi:hypothetical protein DS745_03900 [Anaerobacillus alkaliphilus]|uniref:Uncharacterized protein n=1 Tax=Anaerobacillus alkaliphilus TaxID=1548597 RepID=A0A4Q0VZK5_9BACI|nr:hypothetical protein [Anaerobacillus alkaliphilus]RXJ04536.1 hypothetical protein DS745_03900 [Anaerobacillus alkaliphilus]